MLSLTTRNASGQDLSQRHNLGVNDLLPILAEFSQQKDGEAHICGKIQRTSIDIHLGPDAVKGFLRGMCKRGTRRVW
jgi:hypothetical protein